MTYEVVISVGINLSGNTDWRLLNALTEKVTLHNLPHRRKNNQIFSKHSILIRRILRYVTRDNQGFNLQGGTIVLLNAYLRGLALTSGAGSAILLPHFEYLTSQSFKSAAKVSTMISELPPLRGLVPKSNIFSIFICARRLPSLANLFAHEYILRKS
jgi:hypothetical protein